MDRRVGVAQFGFVDQGECALVVSALERFLCLLPDADCCLPVAAGACFRLAGFGVLADLGVVGDVGADPAQFTLAGVQDPRARGGQPGGRVLGVAVAGGVPADGRGEFGFAFGCEGDRGQFLGLAEEPARLGDVVAAGGGERGAQAVAGGGNEVAAAVDEVGRERGDPAPPVARLRDGEHGRGHALAVGGQVAVDHGDRDGAGAVMGAGGSGRVAQYGRAGGAGLAEGDVRLAADAADADFQAVPGGGFPRRGQGQGCRLRGVAAVPGQPGSGAAAAGGGRRRPGRRERLRGPAAGRRPWCR